MDEQHIHSCRDKLQESQNVAISKPRRITITIAGATYQALVEQSQREGRSLSNTAAYWLERQADAMRERNVA